MNIVNAITYSFIKVPFEANIWHIILTNYLEIAFFILIENFVKLALARDSFPLRMCFHTFAILFVSRINSRLIMYLWCLTTQQPLLTVPNHNHIFTSSLHILFHAQFVSSFFNVVISHKKAIDGYWLFSAFYMSWRRNRRACSFPSL